MSVPSLLASELGVITGRPPSNPGIPVLPDERLPDEELAGQSVEHIEEAVSLGGQNHLARLALPRYLREDRNLHRIPVELVVRIELVVPLQRAGVGVEGDH